MSRRPCEDRSITPDAQSREASPQRGVAPSAMSDAREEPVAIGVGDRHVEAADGDASALDRLDASERDHVGLWTRQIE